MVGRYGGGDLKQCPPSVLYLFLFISRQNICSVLLLILFIAFYPFHSFIFVESNVILITESKYKYNIYTYIFSNPLAYTNDRRNEFRILLYFALVFTVYIINIPECSDWLLDIFSPRHPLRGSHQRYPRYRLHEVRQGREGPEVQAGCRLPSYWAARLDSGNLQPRHGTSPSLLLHSLLY